MKQRTTLRMSRHARQRCVEMGVPTKEVKRVLNDPERIEYPSASPDVIVVVSGRLAVPYNTRTGDVVTVMWHGKESRLVDGWGLAS